MANNERKLATIRSIKGINPIPDADRIEVATVDGWKLVVRKDENFKIGERGVYFEIDSFLPYKEPYMFLQSSSYKKNAEGEEGFRLRTVRLRKQVSQGLLLPLSTFENEVENIDDLPIGTDLTEKLGVKIYEAPIPASLGGKSNGPMPAWIKKTDQERIQNLVDYFDEHQEIEFEVTEKIDGTSFTAFYNNGRFGVCGRNWEWKETTGNTYWIVANRLELEKHLKELGRNIAIQGEMAGMGIGGEKKNPLGLSSQELFLFDIWDIDQQRYLTEIERLIIYQWLEERCAIKHVPVIGKMKVLEDHPSVDEVLALADGKSLASKERSREGIVCKSTQLVNGQTISFKAVSNKYLLKREKKKKKKKQ